MHIRELEDILDELKRKEVKIDRDKRPIYRREVELLDIVRSSPKTIQQIMKEYGTTRTHIYRVFARLRRKGYNIRMVGKGYEVTE